MESFFATVSLILSDQLRHIVRETVQDFLSLFDIRNASLSNDKSHSLSFSIKVVLEDIRIKFEPATTDIQTVVEGLLDAILVAADRIPKVETQLFASGQAVNSNSRPGINPVKPEQCVRVAFENTFPAFVKEARETLRSNLSKLLNAPYVYITEFEKHKALIGKACDVDVTEFLATESNYEKLMEEVKKYRNLANVSIYSAYPFFAHFPLIELQCADFLRDLSDRAMGLSNRILEKMATDYRATNNALIASFEDITKKLTTLPNNVTDMVALQKLIEQVRNVSIKALEDSVEEAKKKLNFMISFSELRKEDFEMNTVLFTWPQKLIPVISEGENNLSKSRNTNQDDLKARKDRLISELEGYFNQIQEYLGFNDYNEINKYLKLAQKLQSRLEVISEKIAGFNHEEELFGWEPTKFAMLATAIESLSPYLTLYQTTVDFQKSYHSWMTGSFLKLQPEAVENDVTNMWRNIYKVSLAFPPNSAPLEFAEITKEQIDRFKVNLPLVSVLCNPGLRDRHWKDISNIVGFRFVPDETTSLSSVLERNLGQYMEQLELVSGVASKEYSFEKAIQKMYGEWKDIEFNTIDYRDTGTQILSGVDDIQTLLDDHIVKTQTMRGSPFIKAFDEETRLWDQKLMLIQVILFKLIPILIGLYTVTAIVVLIFLLTTIGNLGRVA